jgi:UDP-N-acetylmuramoyl-L-alanyl-D-glutamate--2,6-diaminopimelate ligase
LLFDALLRLVEEKEINVRIDSRRVGGGDVFVAISGTLADGHNYISQAVANGAAFVVFDRSRAVEISGKAEFVAVEDTPTSAGMLAQASCGRPCDKITSLAVTGTNGKTTTAVMVRAILKHAAIKCGLIGTIENDLCDGKPPSQAVMTTPEAITIASYMKQMAANGAGYLVMEASSHSLEQKRLAGIKFRGAAFTNLTGDHLDYHKTMDNYLAAKRILFEGLESQSMAVINLDDPYSRRIVEKCKAQILWYSYKDSSADIYADIETCDQDGCVFNLCFAGERARVYSSFCGLYNVSNQLAAAGLCIAAGLRIDQIAAALSQFRNVPGRLERVDCGQEFCVFVDYAHTDDALDNVLKTLKPICRGRLITVFGCGGDRDKTKRPRMAAVAQKYNDIVFVTSDNPRTEAPLSIIDDIKAGFCEKSDCRVHIEPNRKSAIGKAVEIALAGDIILIAGKGHENYQIIGTDVYDFDDRGVAEELILAQGGEAADG